MHTAYDITINGVTAKVATYEGWYWYGECTGKPVGSYIKIKPVEATGVLSRSRLDGSHNNPLNISSRWRSPSSYYGSRYKLTTFNNSGNCLHAFTNTVGCLQRRVTLGKFKSFAVRDNNLVAPSSATTALRRRAIQQALRKFRRNAHEEQVDLSVAYAERAMTANMVADAATRVVQTILLLGERKYAHAWRVLVGDRRSSGSMRTVGDVAKRIAEKSETVGDAWLAYRYGWTPLLGDIYGACEQLAQLDAGSYHRYRIKAQARVKAETSDGISSLANYVTGSNTIKAKVTGVRKTESQARVVLYANRSAEHYIALRDVGVGDPLSTAWELLPYSFVVDWFLGVGDFLEAVTALQGYQYVAGTVTLYEKRHDEYWGSLAETDGSYKLKWSGIGGLCRSEDLALFQRSVLTETDLSFQSVISNWQLPSFLRMGDALALMRGAFSRFGE